MILCRDIYALLHVINLEQCKILLLLLPEASKQQHCAANGAWRKILKSLRQPSEGSRKGCFGYSKAN